MQIGKLSNSAFNTESLNRPLVSRSARWLRIRIYALLVLGDVMAIGTAFLAVGFLFTGTLFTGAMPLNILTNILVGNLPRSFLIFSMIFLIFAFYGHAYGRDVVRNVGKSINRASTAMVAAAGTLLMAGFLTDNLEIQANHYWPAIAACSVTLVSLVRFLCDRMICRKYQNILFRKIMVLDDVQFSPPTGFRTIYADERGIEPDINNPMMRHWAALNLQHADHVIIGCRPEKYRLWAKFLEGSSVHVELLMPEMDNIGPVSVSQHGGNTAIGISGIGISDGILDIKNRLFKRSFDLLIAGVALVIAMPVKRCAIMAASSAKI